MFTLLDRVIAWEVAKLLVLYSLSFLALIAMAVTVPLIRGGAPLWDVLLFLPNQLAFPATLAIPLALITAVLSTVARLREDGELTALMAAGISSLRVLRATVPLAIATALLVGWMAHALLPIAYQNFLQGKSSLLRQAMATKVARQEPIYQTNDPMGLEQITLAAVNANGNSLGHVFAWRVGDNGSLWMSYAPEARWSVQSRPPDPPELPDIPPEVEAELGPVEEWELPEPDPGQVATSLRLDLNAARFLNFTVDPEELWAQRPADVYEVWRETLGEDASPPENPPYPVMVGTMPRWSINLEQGTLSGKNAADAKPTTQLATEITQIHSYMAAFDPSAAIPQRFRTQLLEDSVEKLRELQLAYHLRFVLSVAVVCWWLFAAGLALTIPARNRLTAIAIGMLTVVISVIPAFALVKGLGGHLTINPGYLLWAPSLVLAVCGSLLIWRRR